MAGDSVVLAKKKGEKMAKPSDGGSRQTVSIREMFQLATNWELTLLVVGNIGAMVNGFSQPVLTLLFGDIIDVMADSKDELMDSLEEACVKITIAGVIAAVFAMIQSFCFKYFAEKQAFRYRGLYIQSVLHQDVEWFDARSVASLPTQMSIDAERIGEAFGDKLAMSAMSWWGVIGGVSCAIIAGWQIGLVGLIVCPFMGIAAFFMAQAGEQMSGETQTWYKRAQLVVEECLYAFRTVVAFGSEQQELIPFDEAIEQARQGAVRGGVKIGASYGFANMSMYILYALTVWYGGVLIYDEVDHPTKQGIYTPGSILACLFCIEVAGFSIGMLPPGITAFQTGRGSMARFLDAYVTPCKIECAGKDQRAICPEIESFELSKVYFSYPTRPEVAVLRNLSLKIEKGSKVAVVGESGSGKSTVMALLERFYDPDAGVVFVNGMNMKNFSVKSLRRNIGYVGQEPVLFATSVKENILQGSSISENTDAELERVVAEAELGFVKDLPEGLHTYVGSGGCQFSGGQKQRIVIARALIKKTSVLFFDEATSALDNKSEKMIQHTIDRIGAMAGGSMTMVSIAHRLTTIRNCDLIFVLSHGEAVESGAHDELIELHGTYYALVAAQQVAEAKQVEEAEAAPAPVQGREAAKAQKSQARALQQQATAGAAPAVIGAAEAAEEEVVLPNGKDTASSLDLESLEKARIKQVAKEYKVPMGRVMSFCKPEWVFMAPGLLGAMIDGSALPLSSIMLTSAAKTMAESGKGEVRDTMQFLATLLVALAVIDFCACLTQHACLALVGEGMVMRMRRALLVHFFRQEVGFHDDPAHSPAILGQALELWTYRMSNLVKAWGGKLGALTAIIVGVTTAFIFSWEMALGVLLVIPLMVAMNLVQFILMFGATSADSTGQRAQQVLSDSVQNARICHACVNEDAIVSLYMHLLDKSTQGLVKRTMVAALGYGLSMGMMFWILAAGFYYGGKLAVEGQREFSDVTSAFMGVFFAAMGAGQCAATLGDASKAKVAAHDMFKLLDRKSKIDSLEPTGEVPMLDHAMDAGEISFEAVRFRYPFRPDVEVLKGMTFSVRQGQAVGLVGPSGGGKSTVMAMIQRFYDPDEGSVLIGPGKQVLSNLHIRWWRQQLGFVGQEPILFNTTVKGNLVYGLSDDAMPSDEWIEQCARMANLAFLDNEPKRFETEVGPRGSRLSGGQKQRVAICRALIRNPPVLLFDEATSALDSQSEQIVQSALETVRQGRTSFSIAHRLSTIANCDVILVVASGKMVEEGSHQELLDVDGVYAKLAQAANAGHGKSSGKQ